MTEEFAGRGRNSADRAAMIVGAYVSNNHVAISDLPALIALVSAALDSLVAAQSEVASQPALTPAQVRNSITPDALISFIDGKPYKSLTRHLGAHGLDPHTYRKRFGLPIDYPMVSPSYSKLRSAISKTLSATKGVRGRVARSAHASSTEVTRH